MPDENLSMSTAEYQWLSDSILIVFGRLVLPLLVLLYLVTISQKIYHDIVYLSFNL